MRKLRAATALLALALFGASGYALAGDAGVALTATGPRARDRHHQLGETVTYTNTDSVEHTIAIPRAEYASPSIPPAGTLDYVIRGKERHVPFRPAGQAQLLGQVRVTAVGSVTLKAKPLVVPFGSAVVLSGRSTFPGTPVVITAREPSGGFRPVAELVAGSNGSYATTIRPEAGRTPPGSSSSRADRLAVRLIRGAATSLAECVAAHTDRRQTDCRNWQALPGECRRRSGALAYDSDRKRWVSVQTRRVQKNGKAVFRATLEKGSTRMRIRVTRGAANTGFVGSESRALRVLDPK